MKAALAAALGLLGANAAGDNGVWQNPAPCFAFFAARGLSTVAIKCSPGLDHTCMKSTSGAPGAPASAMRMGMPVLRETCRSDMVDLSYRHLPVVPGRGS